MKFAQILKQYAPDIVTGYNDLDFDWFVILNRLV
jgi:DNA polymerase elongation subunit (family B)